MSSSIEGISAAGPPTLDHVIGQKQAVEQLRVALSAYWNDHSIGKSPSFGSVLMVGPKGTGKTMMARIIAAELGAGLTETLGQSLSADHSLHGMLMEATDDTVVFIDEAHLLSDHAQTTLFRAVEERKLFLPKGPNGRHQTVIPLSRFTLALATTDAHGILGPLADRMKLVLHFDFYSADELAELCRQRAHAMRWQVEHEVLPLIATRSKSTPRLALRLLESCYRTCRAEGSDLITTQHFHRTVALENLDPELGLDKTEQAYLRMLSSGKPLRLNLLASRLGLPAQTLATVIEPYLLREGLIDRVEAGRVLTNKGNEYVQRNYPR